MRATIRSSYFYTVGHTLLALCACIDLFTLITVFQEEAMFYPRAPTISHSYRVFRKPYLLNSAKSESPPWNIVCLLSGPMVVGAL